MEKEKDDEFRELWEDEKEPNVNSDDWITEDEIQSEIEKGNRESEDIANQDIKSIVENTLTKEQIGKKIEDEIGDDFSDFDSSEDEEESVEKKVDEIRNSAKSIQEKSQQKENSPQKEESKESYLLNEIPEKPHYTCTEYQNFFPCASIEYLKKIYLEKPFAGKVFEVLMVESAKTLAFNIQGQTKHLHENKGKNIWIELDKIYQRSYRMNAKRIHEALEIIAKVLNSKLHYGFTTSGAKGKSFLVLNIGDGVLTNTFRDFVQVFDEDYKLKTAELVFLRQVQCGLFRNNEQTFKTSTLLEFGKIAWSIHNCKKEQEQKTFALIERLNREGRFLFKLNPQEGKYFVKDLKAKDRKNGK